MDIRSHRLSFQWVPRLALLALVVGAGTLAACQPQSVPTQPPATRVEAAAETAVSTPVPTADPSATATEALPSPEPTAEPVQRQATTLTILHTNDVMGESDPCG